MLNDSGVWLIKAAKKNAIFNIDGYLNIVPGLNPRHIQFFRYFILIDDKAEILIHISIYFYNF